MGLSSLYDDEEPIPPMVSAFTRGWGFMSEGIAGAAPSSNTWGIGTSTACFVPIYVPTPCIATRMWWANGSSVSASYNIETAIYYDTGTGKPGGKLIATGSVAQGTASQVQFADITDTRLDVGLFWLYMAHNGTQTFMGSQAAGGATASWDELLMFRQQSVTLGSPPDPATPEEVSTTAIYFYVFGFSTNTVT